MGMFTFLHWLLTAVQNCDGNNSFLSQLPKDLQPHIEALGAYVALWLGC